MYSNEIMALELMKKRKMKNCVLATKATQTDNSDLFRIAQSSIQTIRMPEPESIIFHDSQQTVECLLSLK